MRPHAVLVASATALVIVGSGCAATTRGVPQPAPTTVTVVSTVTAAPDLPMRRVFRANSVELGVVQILREDYKISDVDSVRCPEGQPVTPDTSFECSVQISARTQQVTITVKTDDGEYEVGQPR